MMTRPNLDPGDEKRLHRRMVNLFKALDYNFERWIEAQQNDRKIVLLLDARRAPQAEQEAELLASLIHLYVFQREATVK